ncbi:MAG TPA: hypothetical protein VIM12_04535 [Noviherbaspirillum sp.]|uniref:hypothetical protein n=1 Tax=Noviherbaspirillum sp. TaxID=1926288 RepID=UPI002F944328
MAAPAVDGKDEPVREGQRFIACAFSGKKAHAFASAAVKSLNAPHPDLHLSSPKELRCTVVRKGVRAEVKIAAAVALHGLAAPSAAFITDLSMGGASVSAKQALGARAEEGRIQFKVRAAGQDEYRDLRAVLRSVSPREGETGSGMDSNSSTYRSTNA